MQAELAAAVRGNDILRCEVQNALDNLSFASHKLKDFELQVIYLYCKTMMFNVILRVIVAIQHACV